MSATAPSSCTQCATLLEPGTRFCGECGVKVIPPYICQGFVEETGAPCGVVVTSKFCPNCGTKKGDAPVPPMPPNMAQSMFLLGPGVPHPQADTNAPQSMHVPMTTQPGSLHMKQPVMNRGVSYPPVHPPLPVPEGSSSLGAAPQDSTAPSWTSPPFERTPPYASLTGSEALSQHQPPFDEHAPTSDLVFLPSSGSMSHQKASTVLEQFQNTAPQASISDITCIPAVNAEETAGYPTPVLQQTAVLDQSTAQEDQVPRETAFSAEVPMECDDDSQTDTANNSMAAAPSPCSPDNPAENNKAEYSQTHSHSTRSVEDADQSLPGLISGIELSLEETLNQVKSQIAALTDGGSLEHSATGEMQTKIKDLMSYHETLRLQISQKRTSESENTDMENITDSPSMQSVQASDQAPPGLTTEMELQSLEESLNQIKSQIASLSQDNGESLDHSATASSAMHETLQPNSPSKRSLEDSDSDHSPPALLEPRLQLLSLEETLKQVKCQMAALEGQDGESLDLSAAGYTASGLEFMRDENGMQTKMKDLMSYHESLMLQISQQQTSDSANSDMENMTESEGVVNFDVSASQIPCAKVLKRRKTDTSITDTDAIPHSETDASVPVQNSDSSGIDDPKPSTGEDAMPPIQPNVDTHQQSLFGGAIPKVTTNQKGSDLGGHEQQPVFGGGAILSDWRHEPPSDSINTSMPDTGDLHVHGHKPQQKHQEPEKLKEKETQQQKSKEGKQKDQSEKQVQQQRKQQDPKSKKQQANQQQKVNTRQASSDKQPDRAPTVDPLMDVQVEGSLANADPNLENNPPVPDQDGRTEDGGKTETGQEVAVISTGPTSMDVGDDLYDPKNTTTADKDEASTNPEGHFYKKPEEEWLEVGSKKKKKNKPKTAAQNKYCIDVHFYVMVSKQFTFAPSKQQLLIRFDSYLLGKMTDCDKYILTQESLVGEKQPLMRITVSIPASEIPYAGLQYKYIIRSKKDKKENKYTWEHITGHGIQNRKLDIPRDKLYNISEWHQYDCVAFPPKGMWDSVMDKISSSRDESMLREMKLGLKAVLPKWESILNNPASEFISKIFDVENCTCSHIWKMIYLSSNYKREQINEVYIEYIDEGLKKLTQILSKDEETPQDAAFRLAASLAMVKIWKKLNLTYSFETSSILSRTLQLKVGAQHKLTDFEELGYHFEPSGWSDLHSSLLHYLKSLCTREYVEPNWVLCVPLVHFLGGESSPGASAPPYVTHHSPEWWGMKHLENVLKVFRLYARDSPVKFYLDQLSPLFEFDFLLPRSLCAICGFGNIIKFDALETIPLEAVLANLIFHIVLLHGFGEHKLVMLSTLKCVNERMIKCCKSGDWSKIQNPEVLEVIKTQMGVLNNLMIKMGTAVYYLKDCEMMLVSCDIYVGMIRNLKAYSQYLQNLPTTEGGNKNNNENNGKPIKEGTSALQTKQQAENTDRTLHHLKDMLAKAYDRLVAVCHSWLANVLSKVPYGYSLTDKFSDPVEVQVFNHLASLQLEDETQTERWRKAIIERFKKRLQQFREVDRIIVYADHDVAGLHPAIAECFNQVAFAAADYIVLHGVSMSGNLWTSDRNFTKIQPVLSRVFMKSWPDTGAGGDDWTILEHTLTWPSFPRYLEKLYDQGIAQSLLDQDCKNLLKIALERLQVLITQLMDGSVEVRKLELVQGASERFLELVILMVKGEAEQGRLNPAGGDGAGVTTRQQTHAAIDHRIKQIQAVLKHRQQEMAAFYEEKRRVSMLRSMCSLLKQVDTQQMDACLGDPLLQRPLSEIVQPWQPQDEANAPNIVNVIFFNLPPEVYQILDPLQHCKESVHFKSVWEMYGNRALQKLSPTVENAALTLPLVVSQVWQPAYTFWNNLCQGLQQGSTNLKTIDQHFANFRNREADLKRELVILLAGNEQMVKVRAEQIKQYHMLGQTQRCAETILRLKKDYNITGDYQAIEGLNKAATDKTQLLSSISADVVKAGQVLAHIDPNKMKSLQVFGRSRDLVLWLRQLEGKATEAKHLVNHALDLAQGHEDTQQERVTCLDTVISGFAPLIFDLPADANFTKFMEQCRRVWQAVEKDPGLPNKLWDSCCELDWLKEMRESVGAVETSAIAEAEIINNHGIYKVGCNHRDREAKSIDDVIELMATIPATQHRPDAREVGAHHTPGRAAEPADRVRHYKLSDLRELQNKLMLVAGKSGANKDAVDKFVELLDGMTRLANVYMELGLAGSILFKHWRSVFYCQPGRHVNCTIDFGLSELKLQGYSDGGVGVADQVLSICKFLEHCHRMWVEHVETLRQNYNALNYFTTQQLVTLRSELVKLCGGAEAAVGDHVFPLLQLVKFGTTQEDLLQAVHTARTELHRRDEAAAEMEAEAAAPVPAPEEAVDMAAEPEVLSQAAIKDILEELLIMFPRDLAIMALQHDVKDVDEGMNWCIDHLEDFEAGQEDQEMAPAEEQPMPTDLPGLALAPLAKQSLEQMTNDLLAGLQVPQKAVCLKTQLEELWQGFMQTASSTVTDYLSVEHLGLILELLAARDQEDVGRPFQQYFKRDQPNLVLCPEGDLLSVVLSLYQTGDGQQLPLPRVDEVLLCTTSTTAEEVDLLLRRAVFDHRNKVYCLAAADFLPTKVARQVEASFNRHNSADYRLVVVCCVERESSYLVNVLDRCRVATPIMPSRQQLQEYLNQHYQTAVPQDTQALHPAAALDPQHLCVRLIKSLRAGMGKSLKVQRIAAGVYDLNTGISDAEFPLLVKLPLLRPHVDISGIVRALSHFVRRPEKHVPRVFHIDIAHEVEEGVDYLLFNLLILGSLTDRDGRMWNRSNLDLYLIENLPIMTRTQEGQAQRCLHQVLELLPLVTCWSPHHSLKLLQPDGGRGGGEGRQSPHDQLMDETEFLSPVWQRPFQYLTRHSAGGNLTDVDPLNPQGNHAECLQVLLQFCGIEDPAWSELAHFVHFLNQQMMSFEQSSFCESALEEEGQYITFPGFRAFVLRFMIQMSRDFATRSLVMTEETNDDVMEQGEDLAEQELVQYQLKRRWESSPHPYIFFNNDGMTMTFLGFKVTKEGHLVDPATEIMLEERAMNNNLKLSLRHNGVNLDENFDALTREEQIAKVCRVMGISTEDAQWPLRLAALDPTYVLTSDNVKKILAIHMRFRCGIPVIVMGETGCGKTRLVKFMCDLQKPPGTVVDNMVLMKVHGGTNEEEISRKVREAAKLATTNHRDHGIDTVLFLDEANTTEAIGLIKEVMCDHTVHGHQLPHAEGLKIVAACNPYRKHSEEMIKRLERAGLGYHISADQSRDRLGRVPMRRLVYRVQRLPHSMRRLIWDFGQLSNEMEKLYIEKMVDRLMAQGDVPPVGGLQDVVSSVLAASQEFMRKQQHECSFVSLRDVERTLAVMTWFYSHRQDLFRQMDAADGAAKAAAAEADGFMSGDDEDSEEEMEDGDQLGADLTRALVLALGVCYYSRLEKRLTYCQHVASKFEAPLVLTGGFKSIDKQIIRCQNVILNQVDPGETIAKNMALRENFFMMVVCIELRIPLFLVGKPGSSKSLAKTIISKAMEGHSSHSELFKTFKSAHIISFQCSQVSTAEGIVATFRQCAQLQKKKDLQKAVAVVVLDEVGLAEDSPKMPLKTLHPLLEDGCQGDEKPEPYMKVGFIGISNWALDPAKMNRGIFVQRGVPSLRELQDTASKICSTNPLVQSKVTPFLEDAASCYQKICKQALKEERREYFGLRDFYSFMKMLYGFSERSGEEPSWLEFKHAILRNFGGLASIDPVKVFTEKLHHINVDEDHGPDCSPQGLVRASLQGVDGLTSESRYLLILTENYAALECVQQELPEAIIIYGSSFPKDQEYTQLCRNINTIKVCMEMGRPVVLLKLDNLYESLYDALNQYYIVLFEKRFVYLGLGTQRVKVKVHPDFKLVVVAEKKTVLRQFPIPLINRLEKQFLSMETLLSEPQRAVAVELASWAQDFGKVTIYRTYMQRTSLQPVTADVFIGYHADTPSSLVIQACARLQLYHDNVPDWHQQVLEYAKRMLLCCATPDAVLRLGQTALRAEEAPVTRCYFTELHHDSLGSLLRHQLLTDDQRNDIFLQVTTHSRLLSIGEFLDIGMKFEVPASNIRVESLHAFDTEQQFGKCLHDYYCTDRPGDRLLVLQCNAGDQCTELINCARYYILNKYADTAEIREATPGRWHLLFVIQLPRVAGGCFTGFQGGKWQCYHVDALLPECELEMSIQSLQHKSISGLFHASLRRPAGPRQEEDMDVEHPGEGAEPEAMDTGEPAAEGDAGLDVNSLLLRCLHQALSRLRDPPQRQERKAHRLEVLIKLMMPAVMMPAMELPPGQAGLLDVVKQRVALLLADKDKNHGTTDLNNSWQQDAVSFEAIHRTGTCRRALRHYLDSRVTPLMAALLAYADTNENLELLAQHAAHSWLHQLWIDMFSQHTFTLLPYSAVKQLTHGAEVAVPSTGYQESLFAGRLPFSWLIKEQIETLHQRILRSTGGDAADVSEEGRLNQLLAATPLGAVLEKSLQRSGGSPAAVVDRYLHDFVHMVYKAQGGEHDEREYHLVEDLIQRAAREKWLEQNQEEGGEAARFELSLAGVHLAHTVVASRLQVFSQLLHTAPQLLPLLCAEVQYNTILNSTDKPVDVAGLHLALSNCLKPSKEQLNSGRQRQTWIEKVEQLQPAIEQALVTMETASSHSGLGQPAIATVATCRQLWTRVTVLKLFITFVCPSQSGLHESLSVLRCMPLYMMLDGKADFKKKESLDVVEKFLHMSNKSASNIFFGSDLSQCAVCREPMQDPVQLPCGHVTCMQCIVDWQQLYQHRECPQCRQIMPDDFQLQVMDGRQQAMVEHGQYRQRCNAFFMEVVSRLCFAGEAAPEGAVLQKLMGYVTRTSKLAAQHKQQRPNLGRQTRSTMTVFDDCIDPTPVVRSLLLQLLLRSDVEQVIESLSKYFQDLQQVLHDPTSTVNLCMLFIFCLEDHYQTRHLNEGGDLRDMLDSLRLLLLQAHGQLQHPTLSIHKLTALAAARCSLIQVAGLLHSMYIDQKPLLAPAQLVRKVLEAARKLCTKAAGPGAEMPGLFLLRQLRRRYGLPAVQQLAASPDTNWLVPATDRDTMEVQPDPYAALGDAYTTLRDHATKVLLGEDPALLTDAAKAIDDVGLRRRCLLLAVFREVTCGQMEQQVDHRPKLQMVQRLEEALTEENLAYQPLCGQLLHNTLTADCRDFELTPATTGPQLQRLELIVHWQVLLGGATQDGLLRPLVAIAMQTAAMQGALLPTMPQDDLEEIKKAITGNVTMWKCLNGHPYVIGDCGRPVTEGRCVTCGAAIGGRNYTPAQGATMGNNNDDTKKGHILGAPETRNSRVIIPERKLTPATAAVLRALLHLSMLQGANTQLQAVAALVDPPVPPADLAQFLWAHLERDIEQFAGATALSRDDGMLALHLLINHIANTQDPGLGAIDPQLGSKTARSQWEDQFTATFVNPFIQDLNAQLAVAQQHLANDTRLANSPLLRRLYEVSHHDDWEDEHHLEAAPLVWCHRTAITVEHLTQTLEQHVASIAGAADTYGVLRFFLKQERQLAVLQYLPGIVRLQRGLCQRLHHRMDSSQAASTTIADFLNTLRPESLREEYRALTEEMFVAWEIVRSDMGEFAAMVTGDEGAYVGRRKVPADMLATPLSLRSCLAALLPAPHGHGLIALALTHFLVAVHNNLLNQYARIRKRSLGRAVSVQEVTVAHLVAYDRERDLMPLLLANCTYWLQAGQPTEHKYNFRAMQRQIEERFICTRTEVKATVPFMVYSAALTSAVIFNQLKEKIPQAAVPPALQAMLCEGRDLLSLNDCLATVDVALNFLVTTGGAPERPLVEFVADTLKLKCVALQQRAAGCQLRHTRALWLTLAHERAKLLQSFRQDPFDSIEDRFHAGLEAGPARRLKQLLPHLNTRALLAQLYECLVLQLTTPTDPNADDYVDTADQPLGAHLVEYLEEQDADVPAALSDGRFPADILVKHCIATWRDILTFTTNDMLD